MTMITVTQSLTQAPALSCSTSLSLKKPPTSPLYLKPLYNYTLNKKNKKLINNRGICRAEFSNDMPFVIAIGTCVLSSLVLETLNSKEEEDADPTTDSRFSVMGIISFIPFFNWLSWVFAWLDTGKRRYALYSLVYLVPYLRSNLSLSPEEGWLRIASIIFCIVHIQIEASIRNGDRMGFQLFKKASEYISSVTGKKDTHREWHQEIPKQGIKRGDMNLPCHEEQSRNEDSDDGKTREH